MRQIFWAGYDDYGGHKSANSKALQEKVGAAAMIDVPTADSISTDRRGYNPKTASGDDWHSDC